MRMRALTHPLEASSIAWIRPPTTPRITTALPTRTLDWIREAQALGAGEIVLNSIDADGTKAGFDLEVTRRVSESVSVPVVASGGAGRLEHLAEVLLQGKADAVLAASIFHFGELTVSQVKDYLAAQGIPVRKI